MFTGDAEGYVIALDALSGKALWRFQAGGTVLAPPISYALNGRQYIAVVAGETMLAFPCRSDPEPPLTYLALATIDARSDSVCTTGPFSNIGSGKLSAQRDPGA